MGITPFTDSDDSCGFLFTYIMLLDISSWMTANRLTLNSAKNEFLFIGLKQKLGKIHNKLTSLNPSTGSLILLHQREAGVKLTPRILCCILPVLSGVLNANQLISLRRGANSIILLFLPGGIAIRRVCWQWRRQTIKSGSAFKGQLYFQVGQMEGPTSARFAGGQSTEEEGKGRSPSPLGGLWDMPRKCFQKSTLKLRVFCIFAN